MNAVERERLTPTSLATCRPSSRPTRRDVGAPSIVHLGVGAFARAHLGTYADELLATGHPAAIHGVSLRTADAEERMAPQDGLYSVDVREPGEERPLRVVGSFQRVSTGAAAAIDAIADPASKIVTLTVTEKGYVADEDAAPMVLARALARRDRSVPVPTIVPLDNLRSNGRILRGLVVDAAASFDTDLSRWIDASVPFCDSVVDRIVPSTTPTDLADIAERLGLVDLAAVVCEDHRSWALAGDCGRLPFDEVGVEMVADVAAHERRKLWLLNAPHSAIAHAGLLTGSDSIADALDRDDVHGFVGRIVDDMLSVVDLPAPLDPRAFAASALHRFRNRALRHRCLQVATDGSSKLPQRIVPAAMRRAEAGLPLRGLATVVAIWIVAVCELPVLGATIPRPDDPALARLDDVDPRRRPEVALSAAGITDRAFGAAILAMVDAVRSNGAAVLGTIG